MLRAKAKVKEGTPGMQRTIASFFVPAKPMQAPASTEAGVKAGGRVPPAGKFVPQQEACLKEADAGPSLTEMPVLFPPASRQASSLRTPSPVDVQRVVPSTAHTTSDKPCSVAVRTSPRRAVAGTASPARLVGRGLKVLWPKDNEWYQGRVISWDSREEKHVVRYEDGDEETLDLRKERVIWLDCAPAAMEKSGKKRTAGNALDSESELDDPMPPLTSSKRARRRVTYIADDSNDEDNPGAVSDDEESWMSGEGDDMEEDVEDSRPLKRTASKAGSVMQARTARKLSRESICKATKTSRQPAPACPPGAAASSLGAATPSPVVPGGARAKIVSTPVDASPNEPRPRALGTGIRFSLESPRTDADNPRRSGSATQGTSVLPELTGEAADRFGARVKEKFRFLLDPRDSNGRRPGDCDYDPRTLSVPRDFLAKLTGGQRQWWEFKTRNMDKVIFFKMGKFYELFEMDAHIGAQEIGLEYMKGEQPHAGFPEKNFIDNAEKLARKGYRVLVVEQTETPDQLKERKDKTGCKDKVVRREVVGVVTKGTLVDSGMLASHPDAAYLMAVTEAELPAAESAAEDATGGALIGLCVADTATSRFMVGEFSDDAARVRLRSLLAELRPVELIKPRGQLSDATQRALRDHTRSPLINELQPGAEFWDAARTLRELEKLWGSNGHAGPNGAVSSSQGQETQSYEQAGWPAIVQRLAAGEDRKGHLALSALGGCVFYLRQALLDKELMGMRRVEALPGEGTDAREVEEPGMRVVEGVQREACEEEGPFMVMDSAALENLEVLENTKDGGTSGTLLAQMDHCATKFGRRLLRSWLCRPLRRVEAIVARQEAVRDLKSDLGADALASFRRQLQGLPDVERQLARLHALGIGTGGRNADAVVLYEDEAKRRISEFVTTLRACRSLVAAIESFSSCLESLTSPLLRRLVTPGEAFPASASESVKAFEEAFDWSGAQAAGRIAPRQGVDSDFDEASEAMKDVEGRLQSYLQSQRKRLGAGSDVIYTTVGKDQYVLEVPERYLKKVPLEYEVRSQKKGVRRYYTPEIHALLEERAEVEEMREAALKGIFKGLLRRFCQDCPAWTSAVRCIARLDALSCLAHASAFADGPMCTPTFTPPPPHFPRHTSSSAASTSGATDRTPEPWIYARELRHPCLGEGSGTSLASAGSFVPNDAALGAPVGAGSMMLLTGPNMGGKSTLLRQVCLAVILSQLGADVPAQEMSLSPVDRIFVRMGARDAIMAGQSTFLVELSETATMLRSATRDSLVALDELGRGTATSDGAAIAHAVLDHLNNKTGCRGLFSTHYHRLADDHSSNPRVALRHMACKVEPDPNGGVPQVTFLYKLAEGLCPKSYGTNVARLAGLPERLVLRAAQKSAELEELRENHHHRTPSDMEAVRPGSAARTGLQQACGKGQGLPVGCCTGGLEGAVGGRDAFEAAGGALEATVGGPETLALARALLSSVKGGGVRGIEGQEQQKGGMEGLLRLWQQLQGVLA